MIKSSKLRGYCQIRWMTACDCVSSVLRCEEALKNIAKYQEIIMKHFFMDIEELQLILKLIKEAIKYLEMKNITLADLVYWAIKNIWIKIGGRENSSSKLIGQIAAFCDNLPPYNDEFVPKYYTVECCVNHLQNLTKLYTYYVSNAKTELKYTARNMNVKNDEKFYQLEELDNKDKDYGDTEDELVDIKEYEKFGHKSNDSVLQSENYFNFVSKEPVELLKLQELRVVIEPINVDHIVDHSNENFDMIEKLLD
ncbi:hypothetical protein C1646_758827 [Rhizophagus diaphanus]|nr:hypothetical protein C1646_758827 [Rhizophagus diaphanus] [Rhizophagus sp. MUCL 43196]